MMKKAILVACLSVSALANANSISAVDQAVIDSLRDSSNVINNQINLGNHFVTGAQNAAGAGLTIRNDAYKSALITDAQQQAYNDALSGYLNNSFYSAIDHLEEKLVVAEQNLDTAVDNYVEATVALETVTQINQQVQSVNTVAEAEAVQEYAVVSGADAGITDTMQDNYNEALADVNTAAQEFATYKRAVADDHLVAHMDDFANSYGMDLEYADTSIDFTQGIITTTYLSQSGYFQGSLTHSLYFTTPYSTENVYADGEAIYNQQGQNLSTN